MSLLLVAALVGGLAGHFAAPSSTSGGQVTINEVTSPPGAGSRGGMSIPKLVQKVLPSIVSIDVKGNGEEDQGTGMIISKNGLVITNNHVIAAAVNGGIDHGHAQWHHQGDLGHLGGHESRLTTWRSFASTVRPTCPR